ncbi:MAG: [FeFe] hydrogenase H-cluster maturation GTPase HydF [Dorea sp.]|jgi:[FeFe] hydrogenase H-cluster maturation GTPase HydF|nr:[FeFe] hydrogenase H-cluster maturation GTPase HydF [Dorea sp.]
MGMNNTPSAERIHIGIFGRRNAGKSSIINALTGQDLSIVSDKKGTTTDPVLKAMELLPLGPVVMIDTPGLDDEGDLGRLRIQKAYQILNKTDIALLIIDGTVGMTDADEQILKRIRSKNIPYLIVMNKADLLSDHQHNAKDKDTLWVSALNRTQIHELKEQIARLVPSDEPDHYIVRDLVSPLDFVILVVPVDKAAPKGRLILPQQQTIRDLLEAGAVSVITRDTELKDTLKKLGTAPALVITDSQVFKTVSQIVPKDIPLTSFSILFARYKGNLNTLVNGAKYIDELENEDTILICEGCTHHRQCDDIGTVKLPGWLKKHTGKTLNFEFTSGTEFPLKLDKYRLIIHCGGCTLNEREIKYRMKCAEDAGIPMTNYGTAIAYMNGILAQSLEIFKK